MKNMMNGTDWIDIKLDSLINSSSEMVRCCVSKAYLNEHIDAINYLKYEFKN